MNELLKTVLSLSLSGSVLIAGLLLLRPLYRSRLSRSWQYYIWLVVILRLLIPFAPEASLMGGLFTEPTPVVEHQASPPAAPERALEPGLPSQGTDISKVEPADREDAALPDMPQEANVPSDGGMDFRQLWEGFGSALWAVWLTGAMFLLAWKIAVYRRFVRRMKAGRRAVEDVAVLELVNEVRKRAGVRAPVRLYLYQEVSSPMLVGFFRPCIVLPQIEPDARIFSCVALHELTHYRRRDMFYKWLVQLTLCLHWFNPLVYRMEREISRACELSCDEAAVRRLDADGKRAYGDTLLRAAGANLSRSSVAAVALSENGKLLKERLGAIRTGPRKGKRFFAAAVLLTFLLSVCGTMLGAYAPPLPEAKAPAPAPAPEDMSGNTPEPSAKVENPLPAVSGPDEEGYFPPISKADFDTYVTAGEAGTKPMGELNTFLDSRLGSQWLRETYPGIEDWKSVYQLSTSALVEQMYDPYRYQWRDQYVPWYVATLSTEQGGDFDRLLVVAYEQITVKWEAETQSMRPREELVVRAYHGWEAQWQLGNFSGVKIIFHYELEQLRAHQLPKGVLVSDHFPTLWFPEESRALLLGEGGICLQASGLTEPPPPIAAAYETPAGDGNRILMLGKAEDYDAAYYKAEGQRLTMLEGVTGSQPQSFFLDTTTLALQGQDRICIYDLTSEDIAQPKAVLGGDGNGLAEGEVWIMPQIATLRGVGDSHAVMYYIQGEEEWRVCTFSTEGDILTDFSTGLPVVEDYIEGLAYADGLVYFGYYREGSGEASSLEQYCVDVRADQEYLLQRMG